MRRDQPPTYIDNLLIELERIEEDFVTLLEASTIRYVNPNRPGGGIVFIAAADWGWGPSDAGQNASRMELLKRIRDWQPRFDLLFPHPTPEIAKRHGQAFKLFDRWLVRSRDDYSIPADVPAAIQKLRDACGSLRDARDLVPADSFAQRLVVDTNALLDQHDLSSYVPRLGPRYMVHVLPVVLREIDELKRAGRIETVRDAAKGADRRLKSLRDNGDVLTGARVSGDVWAIFEHIEPKSDRLPSWLDLTVPDDRFLASTLLLQSAHPGSALSVATSDLNLQTKLAAIGIPFVEPD